jgi:hypothetical protein
MKNPEKILKIAFLLGIITDALAVIPMLLLPAAEIFWGFSIFNGEYIFAMLYGATFMVAWTILLIWAYIDPIERKFIAILTVFAIIGFIFSEIYSVANGFIELNYIIPSLIIQSVLSVLFIIGYLGAGNE